MDLESKNLKTLGEREEKILDLENEVSDLSGRILKFEEQEKNLLEEIESLKETIAQISEPLPLPTEEENEDYDPTQIIEFKFNPMYEKRKSDKERLMNLETDKLKLVAIKAHLEKKLANLEKKLADQVNLAEKLEKENCDLINENVALEDKCTNLQEEMTNLTMSSTVQNLQPTFDSTMDSTINANALNATATNAGPTNSTITQSVSMSALPTNETTCTMTGSNTMSATNFQLNTTDFTLQGNQIQKNIELKKEIETLKSDNDRKLSTLQKACKKRMDEYKHFVQKVFGFTLIRPKNQYNICSVYASSKADAIKFQIEESSEISEIDYTLVTNEFMESRMKKELIDDLESTKEVPIFLAKYQIDAFNGGNY